MLLDLVKDDISKDNTNFRKSITARERLAICLRFLATGDSYASLNYNFRVGKSTISAIVVEVAEAIWLRLQPLYMALRSKKEWADISSTFKERWNFPNCVGAIDGKHVVIKAPDNSGSLFYNYKGTYSVVLMAVVDPNYNFIFVDVGNYGSSSDGGIFSRMNLKLALESNSIGIPPPKELPGMPELGLVPHVIVGDEAFPLKNHLMRPFPGKNLMKEHRVYNYRHS
ncbi:protein ALP1-like [Anneissia japonica]|uniref:protein ALP1-like n=1 Tax=Anneissia japonica TaxID=1529436 RepID=UPI0014256442|nr:protein ALP1-like [Anneissia japonica]